MNFPGMTFLQPHLWVPGLDPDPAAQPVVWFAVEKGQWLAHGKDRPTALQRVPCEPWMGEAGTVIVRPREELLEALEFMRA
jgi:hypothetical protein